MEVQQWQSKRREERIECISRWRCESKSKGKCDVQQRCGISLCRRQCQCQCSWGSSGSPGQRRAHVRATRGVNEDGAQGAVTRNEDGAYGGAASRILALARDRKGFTWEARVKKHSYERFMWEPRVRERSCEYREQTIKTWLTWQQRNIKNTHALTKRESMWNGDVP